MPQEDNLTPIATGLTSEFTDSFVENNQAGFEEAQSLIKSNSSLSASDVANLTTRSAGAFNQRGGSTTGSNSRPAQDDPQGFARRQNRLNKSRQSALLDELRSSDAASRTALGTKLGNKSGSVSGVGGGSIGTFGRGVISTSVTKKRTNAI